MKALFVNLILVGFIGSMAISCGLKRPLQPKTAGLPSLETGDLIFLDLDCGELCDAIETVTLEQFDVKGPRLSHVGIIEKVGNEVFVLEAWTRGGVQTVSLEHFLNRVSGGLNQANGFYLGRLKPAHRAIGVAAVDRIRKFLGWPYDDSFEWDPTRFYCSELVSIGFSSGGNFFRPLPMFFGSPQSASYSTWKSYYRDIGQPLPQASPGVSPLGIYLEGKRRLFVPEPVEASGYVAPK